MSYSTLDKVLERARQLVTPSILEEKKVARVANFLLTQVREVTDKSGLDLDLVIGGSYAKGTWLPGEADLDLFLKFPLDTSKVDLERQGIAIAEKALHSHPRGLRYSEHPYLEAWVKDIRVNVVPCYDAKKGQWKSAADRSPYHTTVIKEAFDQSLCLETRILKRFLKKSGLYGAEIKVQGFSGYVCEVIILAYKTFEATLREASDWEDHQVILTEPLKNGLSANFMSSLIILDPVDARRNLGSAISARNVAAFTLIASDFLKRPRFSNFSFTNARKAWSSSQSSPILERLVMVTFRHHKVPVDILWGQLRRTLRGLVRQLESHDFKVMRANVASDDQTKSAFLFLIESTTLSKFRRRIGPHAHRGADARVFLKKNAGKLLISWISDDGRIIGLTDRQFITAESVLREAMSGSIALSVAGNLKRELKQNFEIQIGRPILSPQYSKPWLLEAIGNIVFTERLLSDQRR